MRKSITKRKSETPSRKGLVYKTTILERKVDEIEKYLKRKQQDFIREGTGMQNLLNRVERDEKSLNGEIDLRRSVSDKVDSLEKGILEKVGKLIAMDAAVDETIDTQRIDNLNSSLISRMEVLEKGLHAEEDARRNGLADAFKEIEVLQKERISKKIDSGEIS